MTDLKSYKYLASAVVCGFCLLLTGFAYYGEKSPAPEKITMGDILKANETEALLREHDGLLEESISYYENGSSSPVRIYMDQEVRYIQRGTGAQAARQVQTGDTVYGYYEGEYRGMILTGSEKEKNDELFFCLGCEKETVLKEKILIIKASEKETRILTKYDDEKDVRRIAEGFGLEYEKGSWVLTEYVLDPDSLAVSRARSKLCRPGRKPRLVMERRLSKGQERPRQMEALLDRLSDRNMLRTVTFVQDPGTADETRLSATARKGENIFLYIPQGEHWDLYLDPQCTRRYRSEKGDRRKDLTLYGIRAENAG